MLLVSLYYRLLLKLLSFLESYLALYTIRAFKYTLKRIVTIYELLLNIVNVSVSV